MTSGQGPRPLHTIRQEVYQDTPTAPLPPPPAFTGALVTHAPLYTLPAFSSPVGPAYPPPPPLVTMRGSSDEGFLTSSTDGRHLFSPQESLSMVFPTPPTPQAHLVGNKGAPPTSQAHLVGTKGSPPTPQAHLVGNKGAESPAGKTEKKQFRKLPKTKTDNSVIFSPPHILHTLHTIFAGEPSSVYWRLEAIVTVTIT